MVRLICETFPFRTQEDECNFNNNFVHSVTIFFLNHLNEKGYNGGDSGIRGGDFRFISFIGHILLIPSPCNITYVTIVNICLHVNDFSNTCPILILLDNESLT